MKDAAARLKILLIEADDCELIAKLATDAKKRILFQKLARDYRAVARDVENIIAAQKKESDLG